MKPCTVSRRSFLPTCMHTGELSFTPNCIELSVSPGVHRPPATEEPESGVSGSCGTRAPPQGKSVSHPPNCVEFE